MDKVPLWFLNPYVDSVFVGTFHPGGLALSEALATRAEVKAGERVLDIGCGTGATAVRIAHRIGCRVDGIDCVPELIPAARARAEREGLAGQVEFVAGDAGALPWGDGIFAVVLMESTYVFLDKPQAALAEAHRVLMPGGRIGILDISVSPGNGSADRNRLLSRVGMPVRTETEAAYVKALDRAGFQSAEWSDEAKHLIRYLKDLRAKLLLAKMVRPSLPPELRALDLDAFHETLDLGILLAERGEVSLGTALARKGRKTSS